MNSVLANTEAIVSELSRTKINLDTASLETANKTIETVELPTTRTEAWKYTRVAKIGKLSFTNTQSEISDISPYKIDENAHTLVFVNGCYNNALSDTGAVEGVTITQANESESFGLGILPLEGEVFNAINTAYLHGGAKIHIAKNAQIAKTIQILHIITGEHEIANFRITIEASEFSQANFIQGFLSENASSSFCNTVTEINIADNAHLTIDKVQYEEAGNFHISTEQVNQGKNSTFTINSLTLNGSLVRNNLNIRVVGENSTTNLNGAYLLADKQHVDNHTIVDHTVAHCDSNELYKGVMSDNSTAVFNGKVFVREDAQKINAFQSNGNVLLSDNATVNSKPELEIYADDVKCSHGSTTGQLDEEAIFYLRARGLSKDKAKQLMVSAFVGDVLEKIESDAVLEFTNKVLNNRFGWDF